jgi:hypothetical protein
VSAVRPATPFTLVSAAAEPTRMAKPDIVRLSRRLEDVARRTRPPAVAAALQDARFVTDRTRAVYASLAQAGTPSRLYARELQSWLAPGVSGVALGDDDPLVDEWVVVVPGAEPVTLAAADLGPAEHDDDRAFLVAVSNDPHVVAACGRLLGV